MSTDDGMPKPACYLWRIDDIGWDAITDEAMREVAIRGYRLVRHMAHGLMGPRTYVEETARLLDEYRAR